MVCVVVPFLLKRNIGVLVGVPRDPRPHTHTYDFVVLTSLNHPRKILLVVLQIGKAKDLSAPLRPPYSNRHASEILYINERYSHLPRFRAYKIQL
jgi:hypothetical protein